MRLSGFGFEFSVLCRLNMWGPEQKIHELISNFSWVHTKSEEASRSEGRLLSNRAQVFSM